MPRYRPSTVDDIDAHRYRLLRHHLLHFRPSRDAYGKRPLYSSMQCLENRVGFVTCDAIQLPTVFPAKPLFPLLHLTGHLRGIKTGRWARLLPSSILALHRHFDVMHALVPRYRTRVHT